MSPSESQEHQLRLIEASLCQSAPHLDLMFGWFGELHAGEGMPPWEHGVSGRDSGPGAAWPVAALTAVVAAVVAAVRGLLSAASALVTARPRARGHPLAARPERARHGREAGDQGDPPPLAGPT